MPQGLAISNILAEVYLGDLDARVEAVTNSYFRFVDDIFIIVEEVRVAEIYELVCSELAARGLHVHPLTPRTAKGGIFGLGEQIEFLGYVFEGERISVRDTSVDRFLENIAARVTRYRRERSRLLRLNEWMTPELAARVLIDELNERITGAISESRRYGWMFYFSGMTDETLLFTMDKAIESMVSRIPEFAANRPERLKRLARAYHEVLRRPDGAYIHSYDRLVTAKQRLDFLVDRGQLGRDDFVSEDQVNLLFERYRRQQLNELEADLAFLS